MKTWFFIPAFLYKAKKCLLSLVFCTSSLVLSGCMTTDNINSLAPKSPIISGSDYVHNFAPKEARIYPEISMTSQNSQEQGLVVENIYTLPVVNNKVSNSLRGCRIKDRFDRKALLAYEWGRSRMAIDVGGVNLSGGSSKSVLLKYKLRIQPEKTRVQRCRYNAHWQGLVGSGYNELVVRKEDTVWSEVRGIKSEVLDHIDSLF